MKVGQVPWVMCYEYHTRYNPVDNYDVTVLTLGLLYIMHCS